MPTATSTFTTASSQPAVLPLKGAPPSSSTPFDATTASLRSLYARAARAFLHREMSLTHSLLVSAFAILPQPASSAPDGLAPHRRKWDILRITLETSLYASPPVAADLEALPAPLRANFVLAPSSLITSLYARSLNFFTPASHHTNADAAFLPSQVLLTLVLSSLKIDCAEVGRMMVEDWLARRGQRDEPAEEEDGYEKVLETYCLHVLPRLGQWDYAKEFLHYEGELPPERKERIMSSFGSLHSQALSARHPPSPTLVPSHHLTVPPSARSPSPASSISSSSSSLSTTSTHTAVPRTPRRNSISGTRPLSAVSTSTASLSSNSTITARNTSKIHRHDTANGRAVASHHGQNGDRESAGMSLPRGSRAAFANRRQSNPTLYALIRATLDPYLTTPRLTTLFVIFVVFPLLSFVLRIRRRRLRAAGGTGGGSSNTAELVRRRLRGGDGIIGSRQNVLGNLWAEVVRMVGDTIRMGGSGLV